MDTDPYNLVQDPDPLDFCVADPDHHDLRINPLLAIRCHMGLVKVTSTVWILIIVFCLPDTFITFVVDLDPYHSIY